MAFTTLALAASHAIGQPAEVRGGRFTVRAQETDQQLARALLAAALARDTFPGLPRPSQPVVIEIAANRRAFRELIGPYAPEWGAAIAVPSEQRIVMQGRRAGSDAGDPVTVLRHELAHLALHEAMGDVATRWFDEGYASYSAGEWGREELLATNVGLALRGMPSLAALDSGFSGGAQRAEASYALAHRAVAELAALDPERGLTLFLQYWKGTGRFEPALRQAYGITGTAFEKRWRSRTRRRYGGLAFFADLTLGIGVLLMVVAPLYVARRRRDRARLAAMVRADVESERRERESAIEALLMSFPQPPRDRESNEERP